MLQVLRMTAGASVQSQVQCRKGLPKLVMEGLRDTASLRFARGDASQRETAQSTGIITMTIAFVTAALGFRRVFVQARDLLPRIRNLPYGSQC